MEAPTMTPRIQRLVRSIFTAAVVALMCGVIMRYDSDSRPGIWVIFQIGGLVIGALCLPIVLQEKCLKKAGGNKSQASKCFGPKGNFGELVEVVNEVFGLVQCLYEDGNCPDFGAPPHA